MGKDNFPKKERNGERGVLPVRSSRAAAAASGGSFPPSDVGPERVGIGLGDAGVLRLEVIDAGAVVAREGAVGERGVRAVNGS